MRDVSNVPTNPLLYSTGYSYSWFMGPGIDLCHMSSTRSLNTNKGSNVGARVLVTNGSVTEVENDVSGSKGRLTYVGIPVSQTVCLQCKHHSFFTGRTLLASELDPGTETSFAHPV